DGAGSEYRRCEKSRRADRPRHRRGESGNRTHARTGPERRMSSDANFLLLILSSPSGAGKTTLTRMLLAQCPELRFSVSHTTRAPRTNEVDGSDYHFVDRARFAGLVRQGAFLEWAEVHGNLYGTSAAEIDRSRALPGCRGIIFDI